MPNDPSAATLAGIRERAGAAADLPLAEIAAFAGPDTKSVVGWIAASALDVTPLLAAIVAVLELADDLATERPGESGPGYNATRACGRRFRETIRAALAGEET